MKAFPWLMRREIWESRSVYVVPVVFLVLLLLLYGWSLLSKSVTIYAGDGVIDLGQMILNYPDAAGGLPFIVPAILLNTVMLFVWFFYLVDSLYAERKDRSVLFWKSLPISDTSTVLSKLVTAMVVIPVITLVAILVGAIGITLINTVFAWTINENASTLVWRHIPIVSAPLAMIYTLAVQSLWYAPVFAWLLLSSAWAQRAPALWALLPPAGIALLEGVAFRTSNFADLIGERLTPIVPSAFRDKDLESVVTKVHESGEKIEWAEAFGSLIDPGAFLSDPGMWIGLIVAAVFLAGAILLRRYRAEL